MRKCIHIHTLSCIKMTDRFVLLNTKTDIVMVEKKMDRISTFTQSDHLALALNTCVSPCCRLMMTYGFIGPWVCFLGPFQPLAPLTVIPHCLWIGHSRLRTAC